MAVDLSVVIPAYNEEVRLGRNIDNVLKYLEQNFPSHELIIVNDGSKDSTHSVVSKAIKGYPKAKVVSYDQNMGKGFAIRAGVKETSGKVVLFMDADLSTPLTEIPKILKELNGVDIVIGSRGKSDAPFYRQIASSIFDQVKYLMVGLRGLRDTQCGFKAFKGEIARDLFAKGIINRFMFDVEILYLAEKNGHKIREMPVEWADVPGSTVRFWEGIINMFKDLWKIRRYH